MSETLRERISCVCQGRVAFLGIGGVDHGDDGAGVRLAQCLEKAGVGDVYIGGTIPERAIPVIRKQAYDNVVLLDAVDAGAEPGAIIVCDAGEIESRFPQVSTHKLSLSLLSRLITDGNHSRVWLVGIQPLSVAGSQTGLSAVVGATVDMLGRHFEDCLSASHSEVQEHLCM